MRIPTGVLHGLAVAPAVAVSAVVTTVIGAVLPPLAGLALSIIGPLATIVLAFGLLEPPAVKLLCRGRSLTEAQSAALAPATGLLCQRGIGPPLVDLYVRPDRAWIGAEALGRRSVVLTQPLVQAVQQGRLPSDQAAAITAGAIGRVRLRHSRHDLVLELWTVPWQLIEAAVTMAARLGAWIPLARTAWQLRFVVAGVAVVQAWSADHPVQAGVIGTFIALTYLAPWWRNRWHHRAQLEADQFVVDHGLARALAQFLQSRPSTHATLERIHRLSGQGAKPSVDAITSSR